MNTVYELYYLKKNEFFLNYTLDGRQELTFEEIAKPVNI
jgi:hypothetical protein